MGISRKLALKAGAVAVASGAILTPFSAVNAATAPTLTASPPVGLHDGDTVTVTGANFAPSTAYTLVECSSLSATGCSTSTAKTGMTSATGAISDTIVVKTGSIGDGNCAAISTNCYLIASTNPADPTTAANAPIAFGPFVAVSPKVNVTDGQTINVSGVGYPKTAAPLYIVECSTFNGNFATDCDAGDGVLGTVMTNADGTFTNIPLKVVEGTFGAASCKAGGTCYVTATTSIDDPPDPAQYASTSFTFGTAAPPAAATKTVATYSKKHHVITASVLSDGSGINGIVTKLEYIKGSKFRPVATATTHGGGVVFYKHIKKNGKYFVLSIATAKYAASKSKTLKVKV